MRIVLSNIGTFGDTNPLIAIALELKRRGHVPVMALPALYEPKIRPLGLEFRAVRPDIDPKNKVLVDMTYDVNGTEYGLRNFLFPSLHETYQDPRRPAEADPDQPLIGELGGQRREILLPDPGVPGGLFRRITRSQAEQRDRFLPARGLRRAPGKLLQVVAFILGELDRHGRTSSDRF